ncbi:autotransporter outer membrane beta-barrel domain-containing protein [Wohlfahrtiimonas larvae]|uniref:Autotransporter YapL n=1 Tax=Wohlfahrtiimonas larvae TaxID=1157986 RepID=A0ABP9MXD1_9GAMM|nr:autotransporter outer membrane beta-barrel domain-containing protein [Wohlfahrtiimonas larvae]
MSGANAIADNTTINGGIQTVENGGQANKGTIGLNGAQVINARGSAENIIISGGTQTVTSGGQASGSTLESGAQIISGTDALAVDTTVNNGVQTIENNGKANRGTINRSGEQVVISGGSADKFIIEGGTQYLKDGGQSNDSVVNKGIQKVYGNNAVSNRTTINNDGTLHVWGQGAANSLTVNGTGSVKAWDQGSINGLSINDLSVVSIESSGLLQGNVNINNMGTLNISESTVAAVIKANDEAVINIDTSNSLRVESHVNSIDLASETSILNIRNSIYDNASGEKALESGSVSIGSLTGRGEVIFINQQLNTTDEYQYGRLKIDTLSGEITFNMGIDLASQMGNYLNINRASGNHIIMAEDSGREISVPNSTSVDLVTILNNQDARFTLGTNTQEVDGGIYTYQLRNRNNAGEEIWYLSASRKNDSDDLKTSPSVDAVLSIASAGTMIMQNDMQNLRYRRGDLQQGAGDGFWVRNIGAYEKVNKGNLDFKLKQLGVEMGADKLFELEKGQLVVGGLINYGSSDVDHRRGGSSSIKSYGVGAYVTYFDNRNWYIDGVVKYNRFENKVHALSTNSYVIRGNYKNNGLGASLEAGYTFRFDHDIWFEPYAHISYVQTSSKNVSLNNGMTANIGKQRSFVTELGGSLGKTFIISDDFIVSPYIKAAWSRENMDNNKVRFNNVKTFKNDLSGNVGKYGVGVSTLIDKKVRVFLETNYRRGSNVKTPVQWNLGLKYNF